MNYLRVPSLVNTASVWLLVCFIPGLQCAAIRRLDDEVVQQGLYHQDNNVVILTHSNIDRLYGQRYAWLVQFYNSNCGHCRNLAPKFKQFASSIVGWHGVVRVAVIDCFEDENNNACRDFDIMNYPSVRYLHENYTKGNSNIGEPIIIGNNPEKTLAERLLSKLQEEQRAGRLSQAPSLEQSSYSTLNDAMKDVPSGTKYTFMIFDTVNSTFGAKVLLDTSDYQDVLVKIVSSSSELALRERVTVFPALIAIPNNLQVTSITPKHPHRTSFVNAINIFLQSKNFTLPQRERATEMIEATPVADSINADGRDVVRLDDLEASLSRTLRMEISQYKKIDGERLQALRNFVDVLINYFPFRANGRAFMLELKFKIELGNEIAGKQIQTWVHELMETHKPVFATRQEFVNCKGTDSSKRGHTCGLWTIFHMLTVAAALQRGGSGSEVLAGIHDYVKHYLPCSECSQHFQEMSRKNNMTSVKDNDKAVLWLWVAHNEVNLRLAGDRTEDVNFPKAQYPVKEKCPKCHSVSGAWVLEEVYRYLLTVYSPFNVLRMSPGELHAEPLSPLDFALTGILYIFSFIILLIVCKLLFAKTGRFLWNGRYAYRRQIYKN